MPPAIDEDGVKVDSFAIEETACDVIAIGNQKGGVSKTTTTVHLAAALGEIGRRVLIVDMDSSTGATSALGVGEIFEGTCEVMLGAVPLTEVILRGHEQDEMTLPRGVDLVCGRRNLEHLEGDIREKNKFADPANTLGRELQKIADQYDYVLLDTAPNTNLPTRACYEVARWFLIASMPQQLAVEGIQAAISDLASVREHRNPSIELLGVVMNCVDGRRTRASIQQIEHVQAGLPEDAGLFSVIERTTKVSQAQQLGRTILETDPEHKVTGQFRRLAAEVEDRIQRRAPRLGVV
ncbi:MAG: ParA family protein [Planctomycetota bacterium]